MKKINILQVMPEFGLAGAETMCESLCYQCVSSGKYNVIVASLFTYHSPITKRLEDAGINVIYLGKKKGLDVSLVYRLYKILREYNIEIVHTHRYVMQYAIPAAILAGVKCRIHTVHNIANKEVSKYRRKLAHFFYKKCNVVPVSISPLIQDTVIDEYHLTKEDTPVVYNGSDLSKCLVKTDYSNSEPFRFVHIGRFNPQKNHGIIIDAADMLVKEGYDFTIFLIGGEGDFDERKAEVCNRGLNHVIKFMGLQSNIYPYLYESDCFILPSLYEGMPVTLVEAMGCGMPIIASAVGGVPDMIEHEVSGLLIHPTAHELSEALKRLMNDRDLRETMGRNALEKSKQFSAEQMYEGYNNIYMSKWQ